MRSPHDITAGDIGLAAVALIITLMLGTCAGRVEAQTFRPPRTTTPTVQPSSTPGSDSPTVAPRPTRPCERNRYYSPRNCDPDWRPHDRRNPR